MRAQRARAPSPQLYWQLWNFMLYRNNLVYLNYKLAKDSLMKFVSTQSVKPSYTYICINCKRQFLLNFPPSRKKLTIFQDWYWIITSCWDLGTSIQVHFVSQMPFLNSHIFLGNKIPRSFVLIFFFENVSQEKTWYSFQTRVCTVRPSAFLTQK